MKEETTEVTVRKERKKERKKERQTVAAYCIDCTLSTLGHVHHTIRRRAGKRRRYYRCGAAAELCCDTGTADNFHPDVEDGSHLLSYPRIAGS